MANSFTQFFIKIKILLEITKFIQKLKYLIRNRDGKILESNFDFFHLSLFLLIYNRIILIYYLLKFANFFFLILNNNKFYLSLFSFKKEFFFSLHFIQRFFYFSLRYLEK
jgi:hypothetical protein